MKIEEIRNTILKAIFTEEQLMDVLVLKGGNALRLHNISTRESQDVDFSIAEEIRFTKEREGKLLKQILEDAFKEKGFMVNSFSFEEKPKKRNDHLPPFWGGYLVTFVLIDKTKYKEKIKSTENKDELNKYGVSLENGKKRIELDLSYDEYTDDKIEYDLDGTNIYLYSPTMIIYEKIRASCQQLDAYKLASSKTRARDLYDIYKFLTNEKFVDLREKILDENNFYILENIFNAKDVPIDLMLFLETKKKDLKQDYKERVLPQISEKNDPVPFDYLFEYNNELFQEIHKKYKRYKKE